MELPSTILDTDLILKKISVPIGVIGIIFESRADVAPQILSLILRSANSVVLKGGKESRHTNTVYQAIASQLCSQAPYLPQHWFQLHHDREVVSEMLQASGEIDLIVPRGSNELVQSIIAQSRIPVLGHADGVCHLYIHSSANLAQALALTLDAKLQYPAACNALETILVDRKIAADFIPMLLSAAKERQVELRGDAEFRQYAPHAPEVSGDCWHTEYAGAILAVRIVSALEEAIDHINANGSHHTDAIAATVVEVIEKFTTEVDSANVFSNCSTRFADGFRYGFGAEIGISTGRIHARGPVGIEGLMTYKYVLSGAGQQVADYTGKNPRPFLHLKS